MANNNKQQQQKKTQPLRQRDTASRESAKREAANREAASSSQRPGPADSQAADASGANVFNQLVATLEAEHRKLKGLEQRRLRLTEEMRSLREMLHQENRKLRTKSQEPSNRQEETAPSSSPPKQKSILKIKQPPRQSGGNRNAKFDDKDSFTVCFASKLKPAKSFETSPRPLTGQMIIQLVDNTSALRQLYSVQSSTLWHTPVSSVGLEIYLQKSNILTEARSNAESSEEHQCDSDSAIFT